MKILVTGGAGFIGSHIVDAYIKLGHQVVVIDNLVTGKKSNLNPKAIFYQIDITDKKSVSKVFSSEKPTILNHHAAQMDVRKSVADPVFDAKTNIIGLLNLLEEGRKNHLQQVIFASSGGAIYGDADIIPTPETYPTNPLSPYGISKLTSEHYLFFYHHLYNINYNILRYSNVYGPRQNPHGEAGVVAIFIKKILTGEKPIINGDGSQIRDFIFINDVIQANILALNSHQPQKINIGTGKGTDINMLFDKIDKLIQIPIKKTYGPAKSGEQKISIIDPTMARKILNWFPQNTLESGLIQTIKFFKNAE